jgi:hypothetical protein
LQVASRLRLAEFFPALVSVASSNGLFADFQLGDWEAKDREDGLNDRSHTLHDAGILPDGSLNGNARARYRPSSQNRTQNVASSDRCR